MARPPEDQTEILRAEDERLSLCELLDRVLTKGVVIRGDIVIAVADVDLLYLGVQVVLSATETARRAGLMLPRDMTRTLRAAGVTRPGGDDDDPGER